MACHVLSRLQRVKGLCVRKQNGFSVIELLIVIAILLVLAAIAIPGFLQGRMAANEASAASSVAQINTAQAAYVTAYPDTGFASTLSQLSGDSSACDGTMKPGPAHACLLDAVLGAGTKSGYSFSIEAGSLAPNLTYSIHAEPRARGLTGQLSFYSDQTGVIRADQGGSVGTIGSAVGSKSEAAASTGVQTQSPGLSAIH